jgi:hypothetical protein
VEKTFGFIQQEKKVLLIKGNMDKVYSTRSLQIASFLFTQTEKGIKLVGFDQSDLRNIHFQFTPVELCEQLENDYLFKNAMVYPKDLMEAHSLLKEKVFQLQRTSR